jgi:hypothetical protein
MKTLPHKLLVWSGISAVLVTVFALYAQPSFLVTLADQIWACF